MTYIQQIRERLGVTQSALALGMGCVQGNIGFYERGQTVPPARAKALIAFAKSRGVRIDYNAIYAHQ